MRALVVGLGNAHRGDDGAGLAVAAGVAPRLHGLADVLVHAGEPVDLIEGWAAYDLVVLVDASHAPGRSGTIRRYVLGHDRISGRGLGSSSHAFDLLVAVDLAAAIGKLPRKLVLYAIEGERYALGDEPSDAVALAVQETVQRVCAEVLAWVVGASTHSSSAAADTKAGAKHA